MIKRILGILLCTSFVLLAIFGEGALLNAAKQKRNLITCGTIEIRNTDTGGFVKNAAIEALLAKEFGILKGVKIDSLPIFRIEALVDSLPAVKKSQVWVNRKGELTVELSERTPMLRLIGPDGRKYADSEGVVFGIDRKENLDIPDYKGWEQEHIVQVLKLDRDIAESKILRGIVQSYEFDEKGWCTITMKGGKEKYIFGVPGDNEDRISRIETYMKTIKPSREDKKYKTVTLAFDGQIICK